MQTRRN